VAAALLEGLDSRMVEQLLLTLRAAIDSRKQVLIRVWLASRTRRRTFLEHALDPTWHLKHFANDLLHRKGPFGLGQPVAVELRLAPQNHNVVCDTYGVRTPEERL
jgi:hypothetical protein